MSAAASPVLYSFWRSSCAWRVRIALNLKGIEYAVKPVELNVMGGKGNADNFSEINPLEKVPAMQIGMCTVHFVLHICVLLYKIRL